MAKRHSSAALQNVAVQTNGNLSLAFWIAAALRRFHDLRESTALLRRHC